MLTTTHAPQMALLPSTTDQQRSFDNLSGTGQAPSASSSTSSTSTTRPRHRVSLQVDPLEPSSSSNLEQPQHHHSPIHDEVPPTTLATSPQLSNRPSSSSATRTRSATTINQPPRHATSDSQDSMTSPQSPQDASPTTGGTQPSPSTVQTASSASRSGSTTGTGKRKRSRVTPEQLAYLERVFAMDRSPGAAKRKEISERLGMQERQTQVSGNFFVVSPIVKFLLTLPPFIFKIW